MRGIRYFAPIIPAALGLAACNVVDVVDPPGAKDEHGIVFATAPVTPLQVKLLDRFKDGFAATLNGQPIGGFAPPPARNTTVSSPGPACFGPGKRVEQGSGVPLGRSYQEFSASGNSLEGGSLKSDTTLFYPPQLQLNPRSGIPVKVNQAVTVTVAQTPGPTTTLSVRLVPNAPTVSVNGQPAGAVAITTFPPTAAGVFQVSGVSPGAFQVRVEARGVECAVIDGVVSFP